MLSGACSGRFYDFEKEGAEQLAPKQAPKARGEGPHSLPNGNGGGVKGGVGEGVALCPLPYGGSGYHENILKVYSQKLCILMLLHH